MENAGKAHYFAFISHKSADRDFSLKMQRFIENYRLPATLRKHSDFPRRLSPVCCYENDFSANPLMTEMEEKLSRSQFLIIICSKDQEPGGSKYVNFEIETFIKQKQAEGIDPLDRIIPVIVSGAFDSETEECCPAALKALGENRPIGTDRSKYKSDREAFLHAISGMLNIDYAVMVDRDRKRRKKNIILASAAALVAVLLASAALSYFLPWNRHYVDFVMQNGLPVGIEKLSAKEYKKMNAHYVITRQRGKITQLKYVNSKGTLINHNLHYLTDRPAKYEFEYDSAGLTSVTYYDESEQPYFIMQYYNRELTGVDLREASGGSGIYYIGTGYSCNPEKLLEGSSYLDLSVNYSRGPYLGRISRLQYIYNEQGFVTKVLFCADSSNKRVSDRNVFGFEYELDDLGRVRKVYYLDISQNRIANAKGIYCTEYIYDENNNLTGLKHFNKEGELTDDENGIFQLRWTYDSYHNRTKLEILDANDGPMDSSYFNFTPSATIVYATDKAGNLIYQFSVDQNNTYSTQAGSHTAYSYDENGRVSKHTIVDINGNATYSASLGFATMCFERDSLGRVTGIRFTDAAGTPVNNYDGYAYKQTVLDEAGRIVKISYFDADGKLTLSKTDGYSVQTREYDSIGRITAKCYWGVNQEPIELAGYHKSITVYEDMSNGFTKLTESYYDKAGNLVSYKSDGSIEFAQIQMITQDGYITFMASYDQDGQPVGHRMENSKNYNAQGEFVESKKFFNLGEGILWHEQYTYYSHGIMKEYRSSTYHEEILTEEEVNTYYENGKLNSGTITLYHEDGTPEWDIQKKYDSNGNKISYISKHYDNPDFFLTETKTEYNGNIKAKEISQTRDIDDSLVYESEKVYDGQGRELTESSIIYENGIMTQTYSQKRTYQADGSYTAESIRHNVATGETQKELQHFDSEGTLIK